MNERIFKEAKVAIVKAVKDTTKFFKVPRTNVPDLDTNSFYSEYIEDVSKWSASWGTNNKPRGPARGVGLGP